VASVPWTGPGELAVSALSIQVEAAPAGGADTGVPAGGDSLAWSVTNRGEVPIELTSVALVWRLDDAAGPLRMFRHGYQSWSHSGVAVLGIDRDPSSAAGSLEMARGVHHADPAVTDPGELRSEWVTVIQAGNQSPRLVGFDDGRDHDGTLRLRTGPSGPELAAEAFLGGATLAPGERRRLHPVVVSGPEPAGASELLEGWADRAGQVGGARTAAPYQVGWCSWYHYFHDVTEADLRSNLARAGDWPFEVFQLDDGYQAAIGDWLDTNERFSSGVDELADAIAAQGRIPGLWIAPFIVAPDSEVARRHPDWLARTDTGDPLPGMFNPPWGGGHGGFMWALDTTHPEVLTHLESVARQLVEAGYRYLKLDFTFAPTYPGRWHDPSATPAQRVRAGYDAVRRGAGADTFILGCGVPLAHVVGAVDANRIGPDVAPSWNRDGDRVGLAGYEASLPATRHALHATLARSFMHRRLWVNDPDCLMLRTDQTALDAVASRTWSQAVGLSGGMALVSDDLALLGDDARRRLDEAVELGRVSDAAASTGATPRCDDLLRHRDVNQLTAVGWHLSVDAGTGRSTLRRT
jgi:alpha-galactosidase